MRTIRLIDPRPASPARQLPFGSSEWAAESCLADWSQFEREWLGPEPRRRARRQPMSALGAAAVGIAAGALIAALWTLASAWLVA
jgi:hypothetical protein